MTLNIYFFCFIVGLFEPINTVPYRRFRRQINYPQNNGVLYNSQSVQAKISGSIPGTAYYGVASDPNYGSFISRPNRPSGSGLQPISYNKNSEFYQYLIRPSHLHQQQLHQQQNYLYNNNYNYNKNRVWHRTKNDNSQFYNRYEPGNQGWYLTGSDYWFNKGQSVIAHPCLLLITIVIIVFL